MTMMLINLPDMGFSSSYNINLPDRFYGNIKESIVKCILMQNQVDPVQDWQPAKDVRPGTNVQIS